LAEYSSSALQRPSTLILPLTFLPLNVPLTVRLSSSTSGEPLKTTLNLPFLIFAVAPFLPTGG